MKTTIKLVAVTLIMSSSAVFADNAATINFQSDLDRAVRVKIWKGEKPTMTEQEPFKDFKLGAGKSYKADFAGGQYWVQAFETDKDGNAAGDLQELKSRGFGGTPSGQMRTQVVANTTVVLKEQETGLFGTSLLGSGKKVAFVSSEQVSEPTRTRSDR